MIRWKMLTVATFFLLLASVAWTQDQPRDEPKPQQQEEMKPPKEEKEVKPPKADKQEPGKPQDEAKPAHEEHGDKQKDEHGDKMRTEAAQGGQHARPAGKSAHIPDEKFRANFGHQHTFTATRVIQERTVVVNQTRFVYGGYSFVFLDPWPTAWLMTDECYVDYIDGDYFLIDVLHPGMRVALFVVE